MKKLSSYTVGSNNICFTTPIENSMKISKKKKWKYKFYIKQWFHFLANTLQTQKFHSNISMLTSALSIKVINREAT